MVHVPAGAAWAYGRRSGSLAGVKRRDLFVVLAGTFLFGWAAAFVGSMQEIEWLYWSGTALVGLPLVVLVIWLGRAT